MRRQRAHHRPVEQPADERAEAQGGQDQADLGRQRPLAHRGDDTDLGAGQDERGGEGDEAHGEEPQREPLPPGHDLTDRGALARAAQRRVDEPDDDARQHDEHPADEQGSPVDQCAAAHTATIGATMNDSSKPAVSSEMAVRRSRSGTEAMTAWRMIGMLGSTSRLATRASDSSAQ